jgi:hypothetical protein
MAGVPKHCTDGYVDVLVEEEPHLCDAAALAGGIDIGRSERWERLDDLLGRVAALQVADDGGERDTCPLEHGLAAHHSTSADHSARSMHLAPGRLSDVRRDLPERNHVGKDDLPRCAAALPRAVRMLEEHLAAVDREAQLAERCVVAARSKVLDDSAHVLQRDALAAHGGDDEQLDEVGKGVEPDSGSKIELALDGGDNEPVSSQ